MDDSHVIALVNFEDIEDEWEHMFKESLLVLEDYDRKEVHIFYEKAYIGTFSLDFMSKGKKTLKTFQGKKPIYFYYPKKGFGVDMIYPLGVRCGELMIVIAPRAILRNDDCPYQFLTKVGKK